MLCVCTTHLYVVSEVCNRSAIGKVGNNERN